MSSSSSNSWTILTPENQETAAAAAAAAAAETLRPLTERTERQDEPSELTEGDGTQALSEEDHPTAEETITKPCEAADHGACLPSSAPLEVLHCPIQDAQTEDTPVDAGPSSTEQESFSDSYSHLGPSTEDCSTAPLTSETLGPLDSEQQEERGPTGVRDETQHQSESEGLQEEASKEETEPVEWSPLKTSEDPSVQTESITAQEPELRKRRSLLEKIGRHDEEEEAEEDFQLPQREEDSGITLNKCILGAVILLGLGTIFISGVFMDLDEVESEYPSAELKDSEAPGQQEWLNPAAAEADSAELLNKLNKGNEQMAMLQSQLQSHNEEVKAATAQTAEGSAERLRLEEVEKENTDTTPPGGRPEDDVQRPADQQVHKKDKHDRGVREERKEKSEWKKDKKQRKDGGKTEGKDKEKKKDKAEGEKSDKKRKDDKYSKHSEDSGDWKKDKSKRGDEGKPWKDKNEKKRWTDGSDKKSKHDKLKEDKEWRSREERRDFKESKHHGGKGPGDKEWERRRGSHKEEYERKQWKERDGYESRNRKDTGERGESSGNGKDQKKKWKKKEDGRQWSTEEEWNGGEKKHKKDWRDVASEKHKGSDHGERAWSERKPLKPAVGQPEYWARQRERLQHSSKPVQPCDSPDACAQAEGVRPVNYAEFDAVLQNYLSKAQTAGVDATQIDELKKLAAESFQNGVFPHDQMSFQDYVEDVGDILEDLVEGEDSSEQQESAVEDEMEGFEREVMQTFTLPGEGGRVKGERKTESGRGRA